MTGCGRVTSFLDCALHGPGDLGAWAGGAGYRLVYYRRHDDRPSWLTEVSIPEVAAHMFVFYYAVLTDVSPTALSPFAAAAITGGKPYPAP